MKKILLIGGGGHCKSVIDVIEQEGRFEVAGIVDREEMIGKSVLGYKIIATDSELGRLRKKFEYALVTVGQIKSANVRMRLFRKLKNLEYKMPVIVSPKAHVSKHCEIGEGSVVMHYSLVNAGAKIGVNCILNTKSLIEHDVIVGDNCHISTGAVVNGACTIGNEVFIGSNSVIANNVYVVDGSVLGAGSVVYKNLEKAGVYVGNPAKKVK